jgi:hypothetical protein
MNQLPQFLYLTTIGWKTDKQQQQQEKLVSYYESRQIALKLLANMLVMVPLQEKNSSLILIIEFQRL